METFCMVVLGREYVTTCCWRPGVPTRFLFSFLIFSLLHLGPKSDFFPLFFFSNLSQLTLADPGIIVEGGANLVSEALTPDVTTFQKNCMSKRKN